MKNKYKNIIKLFNIKIISMGLKYLLILYLSSQLLNPTEFGMFSLFLIILNFAYLFVGFGVIDTGMYLISRDNNKELCGTTFVLTFFISILFSLVLTLALYYYDFKHYGLIGIVSCGYMLNLFVKKISVGLHERFSMYYFEFFMYLLTFLLIIIFAHNVYDSIYIYSSSMLGVSLFFIFRLKPTFSNLTNNLKYLLENIKGYGIKVHFSQFIAMGTYDLDKLMLKHFLGFTSVGIYNLALTFIMPVKLFSISISEMLFKDFAKQTKIKKEIFILNLVISFLFSIALSILGYILIISFYDKAYYEILKYIYLLPILAVLSSIYVPINHFFSAKGLGKQKFINALVLATCNVAFNFIFIPIYGVLGAIIATILALIVNNIMFIYQYKKYINRS
ncbi:polysaccharide biosynthesis C-terminal domain-containing protein [Rossellomorea sp. YZS02]|uniref:oligosaccharide flippase family protein n=1 Tax=Rossellomorea sp. YZS02 TaxID=3097358 RepID=UPI002A0B425A|nr:polysaccharide biosynthesis C-terminal domain-containing protein [Rossellomorea sp. YZS02]MDX8344152.1 polysaccharide biosynthesis C-terminal domain-containing protein [Rossellomorea sp. YZS02]